MLINHVKPADLAKIVDRIGPDLVSDDMVLDAVAQAIEHEREATRILYVWKQTRPRAGDRPQGPSWIQLYRAWAPRLRKIGTVRATQMIRTLYLEQTMPDNELETPDFVDSYTGVVDPKPDQKGDLFPPGYFSDKWTPFESPPDPLLKQISRAYHDPGEALRASADWVGQEEEQIIYTDSDWQPEHIEMANEGQTDREVLDALLEEIKPEMDALDKQLRLCVLGGVQRRQAIMARSETQDFLAKLQRFAMRGEDLLCVAKIFLRYQNGYCFAAEGSETPGHSRHYADHKSVHAADLVKVPGPDRTLRGFITFWHGELMDGVEAMGPTDNSEMSPSEINHAVDGLMQEYLAVHPTTGRPQSTRQFIAGFIEGVISGADNGMESGWENYRRVTSPEGAAAYAKAIGLGASRPQAMRIFYQIATGSGNLQSLPKRVVRIHKKGLTLSNNRRISWNTAVKIANAEGFERASELAETLHMHRLSPILVKVLRQQEH